MVSVRERLKKAISSRRIRAGVAVGRLSVGKVVSGGSQRARIDKFGFISTRDGPAILRAFS